MRVVSVVLMFLITLLASSITLPSFAATPAMEACSGKWADLKAAGKTKGQTWPEFWSQCSKDFAAKNGEPAAPEKATSCKRERVTLGPSKHSWAGGDESNSFDLYVGNRINRRFDGVGR